MVDELLSLVAAAMQETVRNSVSVSHTSSRTGCSRYGDEEVLGGFCQLPPQKTLWVEFDLWEAYLKRIGRVQ